MFAWWNKRRLKEQRKLLHQNSNAALLLKGHFDQEGDSRTAVVVQMYDDENLRIAQSVSDETIVSAEDLQMLLDINIGLRRLYDQIPIRQVKDFDSFFEPAIGWDKYLEG